MRGKMISLARGVDLWALFLTSKNHLLGFKFKDFKKKIKMKRQV